MIHCGIVPIEMAIRTYVQKYAKTAKIKNIVDTFSKCLESAKSFESTKQEIAENQEKKQEILAKIEIINKKLASGEEAKKFKVKIIKNEDYKSIIRKKVKKIKLLLQEKITAKIGLSENDKMSKREAEEAYKGFEEYAAKLQAEIKVEMESLIKSCVYDAAKKSLKEYKEKISELAQELNVGEIRIDPLKMMEGDINRLNNIEAELSESEKTEKEWEVVGNHKKYKEVIGFRRWMNDTFGTNFDVDYDIIDDYGWVEHTYINGAELSERFFSRVEENLRANVDQAAIKAEEQAENIKEQFMKEFEELDKILEKKLRELKACESCGWDLAESKNRYSDQLFPAFSDLLNELVAVIQNSAYSEEVKSNYTGSLVTRIRSLTNGLNGQIFSVNEIKDQELFDEKVIVDISRIGSSETKSLIMGILIMRLSEYRMSTAGEMNVSLHHVTVLEEAHNILKRTSTEQNLDDSNVVGKSVEMISNAIAEMRTYGEGFIIADQSPSAVDMPAIRNTNTKIIMRLPDEQDRHLAGKSAGLKNDQLDEIAKLPKGVGVVYQNDWLEPVLCKIEKFKGEERAYRKPETNSITLLGEKRSLIQNLLNKSSRERMDMTIGELTEMMAGMDIPTKVKIKALRALRKNGACVKNDISSVIYDLVCDSFTEQEAEKADSIEEWKNVFIYAQDSLLEGLAVEKQNKAIECILQEQIERYRKPMEYLDTWKEFVKGEVIG